jgi:hypothetical protein
VVQYRTQARYPYTVQYYCTGTRIIRVPVVYNIIVIKYCDVPVVTLLVSSSYCRRVIVPVQVLYQVQKRPIRPLLLSLAHYYSLYLYRVVYFSFLENAGCLPWGRSQNKKRHATRRAGGPLALAASIILPCFELDPRGILHISGRNSSWAPHSRRSLGVELRSFPVNILTPE